MKHLLTITTFCLLVTVCTGQATKDSFYYKKIAEPGVKFIPVYGDKYKVFTQKIGNGKIKLLLLHGGPVNTHEYFENFPENLKNKGIEIYFYDQLGSYYSDQPKDTSIWNVERFVDEVEEVRKGLKLKEFFILGHSWGAMLGELYAAKYPDNLKGLILSNVPAFLRDTSKLNQYSWALINKIHAQVKSLPVFSNVTSYTFDSVRRRMTPMDTAQNGRLRTLYNSKWDSVLMPYNYRLPGELPESMKKNMLHVDRKAREETKFSLKVSQVDYVSAMEKITCPVLIIGGTYDRMRQELYPEMKAHFKHAKVRIYMCPEGSHFSMWDDTQNYFREVTRFLKEVDDKSFNPDK